MATTITVTAEPRMCERCAGTGTVEQYHYAVGWRDVTCEGYDNVPCDDGIVR